MEKTGSETSPKSCRKLAKRTPFIGFRKLADDRWDFQSTGRSIKPRSKTYQSTSRSTKAESESISLWPVDRSVDRGQIQRVNFLNRSTAWSTSPQARVVCTSVDHSVDRLLARLTGQSTAKSPGLGY